MISDDEYLERIVAGIQVVTSDGAEVRWNEKIAGRQFDVVVRFQLGTLAYLVVIEVKNRSRRASASDVEAFVTKAHDQNANKMVFVTAAGFQEGAITVGRRHAVDLFTVNFDADDVQLSPRTNYVVHLNDPPAAGIVPELHIGEQEPIAVIQSLRLVFADGRRHELPDEATQMTYYAEKSVLGDGRSLGDLIWSQARRTPGIDKVIKEQIALPEPISIYPPDDYYFRAGLLIRIEMTIVGRLARKLSGNVGIEPTSFNSPVVYTNAVTGEQSRYSHAQLPLNTAPLVPGRFYFQLFPLRYYHCAGVEGDKVTWEMVESFQNGNMIRTTFVSDRTSGAFSIPVTDRAIVQRLKRRLDDYHTLQAEQPARPPAPAPNLLPRPGFRIPPRNPAKARAGSRPFDRRR